MIVRNQGQILKSLLTKGPIFWGADETPYLTDLFGDHLKIMNQIDDYREAISDYEDTNNQLMNLKINASMRMFTTLSFLTFPFMLIAAMFGMKAGGTPFVNDPNGFWVITISIGALMIALGIYFKKREWL